MNRDTRWDAMPRARALNGKTRKTEAIGPLRVTFLPRASPSIVEGECWWLCREISRRLFYSEKFIVYSSVSFPLRNAAIDCKRGAERGGKHLESLINNDRTILKKHYPLCTFMLNVSLKVNY